MKLLRIFACLLVALSQFVFGQTLHPLYKDGTEEVFEPELLGAWVSCVGNAFTVCDEFHFEKSPDLGYRVTLPVSEAPKIEAVFAFHLIRLGDTLFGDMRLTDIVAAGRSLKIDLEGQFHTIYRVSLKGSRLTTAEAVFRLEETQKALAENRIQLHLETLEDGSIVSLASTNELQEFAKRMAKDQRVFSEDLEWDRPTKDHK